MEKSLVSTNGEESCNLPSEVEESRVAELAELRVMLRVDAAHGLHHLFAQFHRRRQRLGIPSEDVAEIDVKEFARFGQHQVIKMTVADAQQVRDDTIASYPDGQDRTHRDSQVDER